MKLLPKLNENGQVVVLVALSAVVLLGLTGLAIDSGIGYGVKAKLNASVDAAAIAAARAVATGDNDGARVVAARQAAERFFAANFPDGWMGATPSALNTVAVHEADGFWRISVTGQATVPTTFMQVMGFRNITVNAEAEVIKRDLDMVLVIDNSGSLGPPTSPQGTFRKVQDAAISFIDKFNEGPGGDRIGLISFGSGAEIDVAINKNATRGFSKSTLRSAINAIPLGGATASAEAFRLAYNEIEAVPADVRSSLRVVVFFSDGAPNLVAADYDRAGTTVRGGLYSETEGPGNSRANRMFRHNQRNNPIPGNFSDIVRLPRNGLGNLPLASYNNQRSLTPSGAEYEQTRCNVNKAARNMAENMANSAREAGVHVFSLGLGERLNSLEVTFCGYGPDERGANILRRLANMDPNRNASGEAGESDTLNTNQPIGLYVFAEDADQMEAAFNQIASAIMRLTR